MTVGERIKEIRNQHGWSQDELAKRAGYNDKTAISKLEHSGNKITLKQVKRIADALGVDAEYLMGWDKHIKVNPPDLYRSASIRIMNKDGDPIHDFVFSDPNPDESMVERIHAYATYVIENKCVRDLIDAAKISDEDDIKLATEFLMRLNKGNKEEKK